MQCQARLLAGPLHPNKRDLQQPSSKPILPARRGKSPKQREALCGPSQRGQSDVLPFGFAEALVRKTDWIVFLMAYTLLRHREYTG